MKSIRKRFGDRFTTATAVDACVTGLYFLYLATSVFSFVRKEIKKLAPSSIGNAFGKVMVFHHAFYVQVFNGDKPIAVYELARKFMMKISALIANLTMDFRNYFARPFPVSRALLSRGQAALLSHQVLFRFPQVLRVLDHYTVRKNSKRFDAYINADRCIRNGNLGGLDFHREAGVPLIAITPNRAGLHGPGDLPVKLDFNSPDLGEAESSLLSKLKAGFLRIANGIVLAFAFVPRVAGIAASLLDPAKEGLKRAVNSEKDVLKDLGMNIMKRGYSLFVDLENFLLSYAGKALTRYLVMIAPVRKTGIVENPTGFQRTLNNLDLLLRRVESVFVGTQHSCI